MREPLLDRAWGHAHALFDRTRRTGWTDLLFLAGVAGLLVGLHHVAQEWTGQLRPVVAIDLSPWALPRYAVFSLTRGLTAYALSLLFTLAYGYWAAHSRAAERILLPLLDILQSIPVLGFMPGLVLAFVAVFPTTNIGLELAAVVMMFTGQVWNMTFSFYHSLRSIPQDLQEVSVVYGDDWWQRFRRLELPFSTMGLVWNSMMSMAGGWFFLMINEAFVLGNRDFRLPGIGSYMSVAVARGDTAAMLWAVLAMVTMIVVLDQLLWRPVVVWAQKFRVEESSASEAPTSWFLEMLQGSRLLEYLRRVGGLVWARMRRRPAAARAPRIAAPVRAASTGAAPAWAGVLSTMLLVALLAVLAWGAWNLFELLHKVPFATWGGMLGQAALTLARVLASTLIGTLWALPAGLAIGLSPRLSRWMQPVTQVAASFPAPMLFPLVIALLHSAGWTLGWGSIVLMLLGTQWYILFNVIAGAMAIPADLREAARSYRLGVWARMRLLYLPAVFPMLVTGWVTAAGGAWNASIVSEYVSYKGHVIATAGIGAAISRAAERGDFPALAAGVLMLAALVVLFNRTVWRRLYGLAEERYSLSR
jgi:NitT/TauT family transport system permease protein